jgi:hypothetical protein
MFLIVNNLFKKFAATYTDLTKGVSRGRYNFKLLLAEITAFR